MTDKGYPIEPALLFIFRLFVSLRLLYSLLLILLNVVAGEPPDYANIFGLVTFAGTLVYLSSHRLLQRLGRYFPVALGVVTLTLILEKGIINLHQALRWQEFLAQPGVSLIPNIPWLTLDLAALEYTWPPLIYVPLVLIAWQYSFRGVLVFVVATISAYLMLNALLYRDLIAGLTELSVVIVTRILAFGVVGYTVVYLSRALREQRNALRESNARLVNHLTTREQLATSQERNRLARAP